MILYKQSLQERENIFLYEKLFKERLSSILF